MDDEAAMESWATYLVEGYRPGISVESLRRAADRLRKAADDMAREGERVRYVHSTIVPEDESCLVVIAAASERLVHEAYARARVDFDRISTALSPEVPELQRRVSE